uniref:Uncharacterized protein n=1 Tax=Anguilla anguilla TaxID=7936 RepID=A0A0E9SE53_ANGAN
MRASAKYGNIM